MYRRLKCHFHDTCCILFFLVDEGADESLLVNHRGINVKDVTYLSPG